MCTDVGEVGGGVIFTSATGSSLHPYISLLLSSLTPLCSSLLLARSLQSLASELTTIQRAINHPDKSVSIAWLGRHETVEEEVEAEEEKEDDDDDDERGGGGGKGERRVSRRVMGSLESLCGRRREVRKDGKAVKERTR